MEKDNSPHAYETTISKMRKQQKVTKKHLLQYPSRKDTLNNAGWIHRNKAPNIDKENQLFYSSGIKYSSDNPSSPLMNRNNQLKHFRNGHACSSPISSSEEEVEERKENEVDKECCQLSTQFEDMHFADKYSNNSDQSFVPSSVKQTKASQDYKKTTAIKCSTKEKKPVNVFGKAGKFPREKMEQLICDASDECRTYLYESLKDNMQACLSMKFGFGYGHLVEIPFSWSKNDRSKLVDWLQKMGFHAKYNHTVFYTSNEFGHQLFRLLAQHITLPFYRDETSHNLISESQSKFQSIADHSSIVGDSFDSLRDDDISVIENGSSTSLLQASNSLGSANNLFGDNIFTIQECCDFSELPLNKNGILNMKEKRERNRARRLSRLGSIDKYNDHDRKLPYSARRLSVFPEEIPALYQPSPSLSNNLNEVISLILNRGFFQHSSIIEILIKVSKKWRKFGINASAWLLADYETQPITYDSAKLCIDFPVGKFLSDGSFKDVFQVWVSAENRFDAISVMNVESIKESGNQQIIKQEVRHSLLLSNLVKERKCPNYVEVYQVFLSNSGAPKMSAWNESKRDLEVFARSPKAPSRREDYTETGLYQYIRMELCDGGDLERYIQKQVHSELPLLEAVIPFLFQMAFSLYVGREQYSLRHYDVKLLNFFLKRTISKGNKTLVLSYIVGNEKFQIKLPEEHAYLVKLADYGTVDTDSATLGQSIGIDQFTTYENTPIDFLLLGSQAVQDYAADTFSFGLCVLHLFTGGFPYEEILQDVYCPDSLMKTIKKIWRGKAKKLQDMYKVLDPILKEDDENILFHTIYRYLVLFGIPEEDPFEETCPLWDAITSLLRPSGCDRPRRNKIGNETYSLYARDCAAYSVLYGESFYISRARKRLHTIPCGMDMLMKMVSYAPSQRPTMCEVMLSPLFENLRKSDICNEENAFIYNFYKANTMDQLKNV